VPKHVGVGFLPRLVFYDMIYGILLVNMGYAVT
jgi:hypothetical protein